MAVEHKPTAVVHKGQKEGATGCGTNAKEHSTHWENTTKSVTCNKNGCKN